MFDGNISAFAANQALLKSKNTNTNTKKKKVSAGIRNLVLEKKKELDMKMPDEVKRKKRKRDKIKNNLSNEVKNKKKKESELPFLILRSSIEKGKEMLGWLLHPIQVEKFFDIYWERKALHIVRHKSDFYNKICTLKDFDFALRHCQMYFTKNIDVTSYVNGVRRTENPNGRANASTVWDFYKKGKSIRLLNPQTFIPNVAKLTSALQEYFRCFVGANIYLTPPGTQGFAPHYDDIEAFVLQLEGEKQWFLYDPRSCNSVLPRESSENFKENEIGKAMLEVTLKPGDLLYFPRGVVHQARCISGKHSLHITVSCYQKNAWADLLEKVVPVALERAIEEDVEYREGLPLDYLDHLGLVHSDSESDKRSVYLDRFRRLLLKLIDYCPIDAGADQLAKQFMHDALPPYLSPDEIRHSRQENEEGLNRSLLECLEDYSDKPLAVKLIRANVLRLVSEEETLRVHYCSDNGTEYHSQDAMFFEIPMEWAEGIEYLMKVYPNFCQLREIPVSVSGRWKETADFVYFLWQKGLIFFDKPISEIFMNK